MYSFRKAVYYKIPGLRNYTKLYRTSNHGKTEHLLKPETFISRINLYSSQSCESLSYVDAAQSPLILSDLSNLHADAQDILRKNINSDELYNITAHHFKNCSYDKRPWNIIAILTGKAVNCHFHKDGSLSGEQRKVLALTDIFLSANQISDDISDANTLREDFPPAYVQWNFSKAMFAVKACTAVTVNEAAKMNADVLKKLCILAEQVCRGQYVPYEATVLHSDFLAHYYNNIEHRSGYPFQVPCKLVTECNPTCTIQIGEAMSKFGYHYGMYFAVFDDIEDLEYDVTVSSLITAPVIFASKEHPILKEIMRRKFGQKGDAELAITMVKNSNGVQRAKKYGGGFITEARRYLLMLAPSPYRSALEGILRYHMEEDLGLDTTDVHC